MTQNAADLVRWSWLFMALYIAVMLWIGWRSQRRVHTADDFATARGGYGPLFLAFAFAATGASGATFIGMPGVAYATGLSAAWMMFLYPIGLFIGILLCMRVVMRTGNALGSRSIPEYLGDRYQSPALRIVTAVFSLLLFFYLAGQLVSCLVMFQTMLGVSAPWALAITCTVLTVYVTAGGAHADILTDGIQGVLMLGLALLVLALFLGGYGFGNGFAGLLEALHRQDPRLVQAINPAAALTGSWWSVVALVVSTIPFGLMPHLGNKLWALEHPAQRRRFVGWVLVISLLMPAIGLGGILARALLGDSLAGTPGGGNDAILALFLTVFPTWVAALLGAGILSAVMSTADGLVISSSQVIANDLYRRSIAPRWHRGRSPAQVEATTLAVSRWASLATLAISALLAWQFMQTNVLLIVWMGLGGMMAALAGPLVLGSLWRGVTRAGAIGGFAAGAASFIVLHAGLLPDGVIATRELQSALDWLRAQAPNPYACTVLGELTGCTITALVSLATQPLPESHLAVLFPRETGDAPEPLAPRV